MRPSLAAVLLLLAIPASAAAHGGVWRPPGGDVTSPGGAGAPTTGGKKGFTAGGAFRKGTASLDRWEAWWYFQREAYLPRHSTGRMASKTAPSGIPSTSGVLPLPDHPATPLLGDLARRDVLPVLVAALDDKSSEVVDSAAIALGRSVATEAAGPFVGPLSKTLAHEQRTPQQSAVLGLGILGGAEAAKLLRAIVDDSPQGRVLVGETGPIDELLRGLAALALGLAPQKENVELLAFHARAPATSRDLGAACVLALGMHAPFADAAIAELLPMLEQESLDREIRAQVPIALHRLPGARALLPKLVELLGRRQLAGEIARSVAIAVGDLAEPEESEAVDALITATASHDDTPTRHFALLALGRMFERNGATTEAAATRRDQIVQRLLGILDDSDRRTDRPFAALALGLVGRGDRFHSRNGQLGAKSAFAGNQLIELFTDENDPSLRGAFGIALGLMSEPDAGPKLLAEISSTQNPTLIGHLATGLALLAERSAIPLLRLKLADRSLHPAVRIDVARALGMLEDHGFEEQLLALLAKAEDIPQAAAYGKALGLLAGPNAIPPLVALVEQKELPEFRRAFAIVALGLLAEKSDRPWNAPYLIDANFTSLVRPLQEVFDIL